jgi:hypothetical protein
MLKRLPIGILIMGMGMVCAQDQPPPETPPPPTPPPTQTLDPNQLANLVAPIALYPDPLLSEVLVAATYPLEMGAA